MYSSFLLEFLSFHFKEMKRKSMPGKVEISNTMQFFYLKIGHGHSQDLLTCGKGGVMT